MTDAPEEPCAMAEILDDEPERNIVAELPLPTTLPAIEAKLAEVLKREAANVIKAGKLLCDAKRRVDHGHWGTWLEEKFSLSERSAQRYMAAYRFAKKNDIVADLNMGPGALYLLAEGDFSKTVIAACVELSLTKRVGRNDVWESYRCHRPRPDQPAQSTDVVRVPRFEPTANEIKQRHEEWVKNGKPTFEAEQKLERERAAAHAAMIALSRFKEECDLWLSRMTVEERHEALRYVAEIVSQQDLPLEPLAA
jgi:hypothetical protein